LFYYLFIIIDLVYFTIHYYVIVLSCIIFCQLREGFRLVSQRTPSFGVPCLPVAHLYFTYFILYSIYFIVDYFYYCDCYYFDT